VTPNSPKNTTCDAHMRRDPLRSSMMTTEIMIMAHAMRRGAIQVRSSSPLIFGKEPLDTQQHQPERHSTANSRKARHRHAWPLAAPIVEGTASQLTKIIITWPLLSTTTRKQNTKQEHPRKDRKRKEKL